MTSLSLLLMKADLEVYRYFAWVFDPVSYGPVWYSLHPKIAGMTDWLPFEVEVSYLGQCSQRPPLPFSPGHASRMTGRDVDGQDQKPNNYSSSSWGLANTLQIASSCGS